MTKEEIEILLERAAELGAAKALHSIGLGDEDAIHDIKELRGWLKASNLIKTTALRSAVGILTKVILLALLLGIMYLAGIKVELN